MSSSIVVDNKYLSRPKANLRARFDCLQLLGGRCVDPDCRWMNTDGTLGCTDFDYLQIDHVENDGYFDRRPMKHWRSIYVRYLQEILAGSKRYQILCANCNYKKAQRFRPKERTKPPAKNRTLRLDAYRAKSFSAALKQ